jgi:hypothetical protein
MEHLLLQGVKTCWLMKQFSWSSGLTRQNASIHHRTFPRVRHQSSRSQCQKLPLVVLLEFSLLPLLRASQAATAAAPTVAVPVGAVTHAAWQVATAAVPTIAVVPVGAVPDAARQVAAASVPTLAIVPVGALPNAARQVPAAAAATFDARGALLLDLLPLALVLLGLLALRPLLTQQTLLIATLLMLLCPAG